MLIIRFRAGNRQNELQLERLYVEGQAIHNHQKGILEDIHQATIRQKPALAAEIEKQMVNLSLTLQATIRENTSSLSIPQTRRRRSEDLLDEDSEGSQRMTEPRPRSQSVGVSRFSSKDVVEDDRLSSLESLTVSRRKPRYLNTATDDTSNVQHEPTVAMQVSHRQSSQCRRPCSCQCHRSSKVKTPDFLRQVTGQLMVGYAGIASFTPPCNEHACAQRQKALVRIQYSFPVWSLMQRMLTLVSYSGGIRGPEKVLRMSRMRPGLDEVFIQVQSGNMNRLQQLFILGDASPLDASDTGWTLLHYALTAGQLTTAKFLKDAGADIHAESSSRETPFDVAWNRILSNCLDDSAQLLLRDVFNDDDQLDERQFTPLHKIILGMIGKDLADELDISTAYIDALDSSGYTPLAWASARGDSRSVALLLEHGASISIANDVGAEPIHLAAQTGNVHTIEVLVRAGADVNREVRQTHMTAIHFAAEYQDNSEQIEGLAELGARIDGKDYLSWTPLHWAAWRGHSASLSALLACRASVLARTADGNAAIMLAVANNSHECVGKLLEAGADCSVVRDSQWNIMHYAAIGGSVNTVRSLCDADLSGVDLEGLETRDTGQSVTDMLSARLEAFSVDNRSSANRKGWESAWNAMADAIPATREVKQEPELFSPPTRSNTESVYLDADDAPFDQRDGFDENVSHGS